MDMTLYMIRFTLIDVTQGLISAFIFLLQILLFFDFCFKLPLCALHRISCLDCAETLFVLCW